MSSRTDSLRRDGEPEPTPREPTDERREVGNAGLPPTDDTRTARVVRTLARLYPWPVDASDELEQSLAFLGASVIPEAVVRAGYGAALLALPAIAVAALVARVPPVLAALAAPVGAVGTAHVVHVAPVVGARLRRTTALGDAPDLVGRAVLRMRISPTPESAARFAAETGDGPLADSLAEHVRRARGTGNAGFDAFAEEWADWFPSLRRAMQLVNAAGDAPATERDRTLDRALSAVLDGTRDRAAEFASEIQGPATGLYAFGVLLPLAIAAVVPAARVAGLPLGLPAVVALYDLVLPAGIFAAGIWLLSRRPVAFGPPAVPPDHPEVPDRRVRALPVATLAATVGWFVSARLLPWASPLVAAGLGIGVGAVLWFRPEKRVRDRALAVETGLADALYLVGRRVDGGTAVETAVELAAEEVSGETGDVLGEAARRQQQLRVGVREAFLGEHGPLAVLPSPRARSSVAMLALAAREGRPAGSAAVALADHLEELESVERDARNALSRVTDTLASTAALFAPLVGGVTVGLADAMGSVGGAEPLPTPGLGLAVGAYVLLLSVLLTGLSVGLDRGLDRALVGYRSGAALISATVVYLAVVVATGALI